MNTARRADGDGDGDDSVGYRLHFLASESDGSRWGHIRGERDT